MKLKYWSLLLIIPLIEPCPALQINQQAVQQEIIAYYHQCEAAAAAGDPEAMVELGYLLFEGGSIEKNISQALQYFIKAANMGQTEAQCMLGNIYFGGLEGVPRDHHLALQYYQQAARNGDDKASYMVGLSYMKGLGVDKNIDTAVTYLQEAAKKNNSKAQLALGDLSRRKEVKLSNSTLYWYARAAEQGEPEAAYRVGMSYRYPDTASDIRRKIAFKRFEDAAIGGNREANYELALCYIKGYGVEKDLKLGINYMIDAASLGHIPARFYTCWSYLVGHGLKQSLKEAAYWGCWGH